MKENGEVLYNVQTSVCKRCRNCVVCVYFTLDNYNLFSNAYRNIGLAYKYLLTLSTTQVACERSFSILKFIKNRLRSTLTSNHLEAFMLMSEEKDILQGIDNDVIIDGISAKSSLLKKELYYQ